MELTQKMFVRSAVVGDTSITAEEYVRLGPTRTRRRGDLDSRSNGPCRRRKVLQSGIAAVQRFNRSVPQKPAREVVVKLYEPTAEELVAAASSGVEVSCLGIVPNTTKAIAKRLMYVLKTHLTWTDRCELIYDGAPVPGRNTVVLVNDVLGKRRNSDPMGYQMFAQQLKRTTLPREIEGNVDRRHNIQKGVCTPEQLTTASF